MKSAFEPEPQRLHMPIGRCVSRLRECLIIGERGVLKRFNICARIICTNNQCATIIAGRASFDTKIWRSYQFDFVMQPSAIGHTAGLAQDQFGMLPDKKIFRILRQSFGAFNPYVLQTLADKLPVPVLRFDQFWSLIHHQISNHSLGRPFRVRNTQLMQRALCTGKTM